MRFEPTRAWFNGLVVAVVLLFFAGVAGAVVDPGSQRVKAGDRDEAAQGDTTSTTGPEGSSDAGSSGNGEGGDAPAGGSGGTAGGGGSGGAAAPATDGAAASKAPNPSQQWTPPKDGTYKYKVEGEEEHKETVIRTLSNAGGVVRQSLSGVGSVGSGDVETVWNGQGWTWERINASANGQSSSCAFEPPLQTLPQPVKTGASWSFDSRCTFTYGATTVVVHVQGSGKVTGADRVDVGGTLVDVWVVERQQKVTVSYGGKEYPSEGKSTEKWSPAHGLLVESRTEGGQDGAESRKLVSLKPQ